MASRAVTSTTSRKLENEAGKTYDMDMADRSLTLGLADDGLVNAAAVSDDVDVLVLDPNL